MQIVFRMELPREAVSVPLVRHVCRDALLSLEVTQECVADIEVAITEACTNVLKHAMAHDLYRVEVEISPELCRIRVVDAGKGVESYRLGDVDTHAEGGRGLRLMSVLVDSLRFEAKPPTGGVVELVKRLDAPGEAVITRLA